MITIRSLAAVLLLSIPAALFAQQPAKQSAPPPQAPQSHKGEGWQEEPMTDARRGSKYTQFTLDGKFIKRPGQNASDRPELVVNCKPGGRMSGGAGKLMSATLQMSVPLKIDYVEPTQLTTGTSYYPKVDVHYGLDDGKSEKEQWSAGSDKTSATFSKEALKKLLHSHTVIIAMEGDAGSELSAQFDLPDSTQVAQSCGIDLRKK